MNHHDVAKCYGISTWWMLFIRSALMGLPLWACVLFACSESLHSMPKAKENP